MSTKILNTGEHVYKAVTIMWQAYNKIHVQGYPCYTEQLAQVVEVINKGLRRSLSSSALPRQQGHSTQGIGHRTCTPRE